MCISYTLHFVLQRCQTGQNGATGDPVVRPADPEVKQEAEIAFILLAGTDRSAATMEARLMIRIAAI